jgi:hypothetical protein
MASVYQKRGVWYARHKDAAGRWVGVSLKAQTKTEAKRLAQDLERKAERQRHGLEALPSDSALTLGELCEWCSRNAARRRASIESRCGCVSTLSRSLSGERRCAWLRPRRSRRLREMALDDLGPVSLNGIRGTLHTVYSRARKAGLWTGPNPTVDVDGGTAPCRSLIPRQADHRFHAMPITDSTASRSLNARAVSGRQQMPRNVDAAG